MKFNTTLLLAQEYTYQLQVISKHLKYLRLSLVLCRLTNRQGCYKIL
jgi:hypothetical protein